MTSSINPQFPYYLLLYVLTVIIRLIRAYKARPKKGATAEHKHYWTNYLYFGFELVNVSAGVFILLSQNSASFVATFMLMYVILVVISNFLEDEHVDVALKTAGHVIVSVVIISITCYAFLNDSYIKSDTIKTQPVISNKWKVALPYMDTSLNRNYSVKTDIIKSVYVCEVEAKTKPEAIISAKEMFYSEKGPNVYLPKIEKSPISMIVLDVEIVAEQLPVIGPA